MRRRRHLLFLIILWSICALTTFVFCKGLDSTVKASFGKNENNEKKEYTYDLEVSNLDNLDKLSFRRALNKVLTSSKVFDYYSYYVTSGTVVGLNNPNYFNISAKNTTSKDEQGAFHTNYEVRVIFLDRNAAARVATTNPNNTAIAAKLVKMFDGDKDYNDILPVCFDYAWSATESSSLYGNPEEGYPLSRVKTLDEDYSIDFKLSVSDFFNRPGESFESISLGNKPYSLKGAIIIPLRDIGSGSSGDKQARREYWEHIYDMRNRGVIISDMKPDELQKYMDSVLADENNAVSGKKLSEFFRIKINEADYGNKLLYNDKINDIKRVTGNIATAAMIIAGALLLLYLLVSVSKNQRYQFLAYINGTGKLEFWLIYVLQIAVWFVFTVFPSYALYFGLMKLMKTDFVDLKEYIRPAAIIALVSFAVVSIRMFLWNTGKILRRI